MPSCHHPAIGIERLPLEGGAGGEVAAPVVVGVVGEREDIVRAHLFIECLLKAAVLHLSIDVVGACMRCCIGVAWERTGGTCDRTRLGGKKSGWYIPPGMHM